MNTRYTKLFLLLALATTGTHTGARDTNLQDNFSKVIIRTDKDTSASDFAYSLQNIPSIINGAKKTVLSNAVTENAQRNSAAIRYRNETEEAKYKAAMGLSGLNNTKTRAEILTEYRDRKYINLVAFDKYCEYLANGIEHRAKIFHGSKTDKILAGVKSTMTPREFKDFVEALGLHNTAGIGLTTIDCENYVNTLMRAKTANEIIDIKNHMKIDFKDLNNMRPVTDADIIKTIEENAVHTESSVKLVIALEALFKSLNGYITKNADALDKITVAGAAANDAKTISIKDILNTYGTAIASFMSTLDQTLANAQTENPVMFDMIKYHKGGTLVEKYKSKVRLINDAPAAIREHYYNAITGNEINNNAVGRSTGLNTILDQLAAGSTTRMVAGANVPLVPIAGTACLTSIANGNATSISVTEFDSLLQAFGEAAGIAAAHTTVLGKKVDGTQQAITNAGAPGNPGELAALFHAGIAGIQTDEAALNIIRSIKTEILGKNIIVTSKTTLVEGTYDAEEKVVTNLNFTKANNPKNYMDIANAFYDATNTIRKCSEDVRSKNKDHWLVQINGIHNKLLKSLNTANEDITISGDFNIKIGDASLTSAQIKSAIAKIESDKETILKILGEVTTPESKEEKAQKDKELAAAKKVLVDAKLGTEKDGKLFGLDNKEISNEKILELAKIELAKKETENQKGNKKNSSENGKKTVGLTEEDLTSLTSETKLFGFNKAISKLKDPTVLTQENIEKFIADSKLSDEDKNKAETALHKIIARKITSNLFTETVINYIAEAEFTNVTAKDISAKTNELKNKLTDAINEAIKADTNKKNHPIAAKDYAAEVSKDDDALNAFLFEVSLDATSKDPEEKDKITVVKAVLNQLAGETPVVPTAPTGNKPAGTRNNGAVNSRNAANRKAPARRRIAGVFKARGGKSSFGAGKKVASKAQKVASSKKKNAPVFKKARRFSNNAAADAQDAE